MESVSVSREISAPAESIRELMSDYKSFFEGAGFDEVRVDSNQVEIGNNVGLLSVELKLEIMETDADLAYRQLEGIFKNMETRFDLEGENGRTVVTATTDFELDASIVGPILDATIVSKQRKKEINKQLDYLEEASR